MANEINEAKQGLVKALSAIEGLRVFDHAPDTMHQLPAAIVRLETRKTIETLGGGALMGTMRVETLVAAADAQQAFRALNAFIDPSGASSVEAAVDADPTWGGAVDDARLVSVDNIGGRKRCGVSCLGANFHFRFVKSVRG